MKEQKPARKRRLSARAKVLLALLLLVTLAAADFVL